METDQRIYEIVYGLAHKLSDNEMRKLIQDIREVVENATEKQFNKQLTEK